MRPTPTILDAFLGHAERDPSRPCLEFDGRELGRRELLHQALRWTAGLRTLGLKPGDRVALYLENCPQFVFAYLGAQLAGATVVLVNSAYRQVELRHILADAGVRVCVTDAERLPQLARVTAELGDLEKIVLADDAAAQDSGSPRVEVVSALSLPEAPAPLELPEAGADALIAYTSGTTGRSKGAVHTHASLAANAAAVAEAWLWTEADRLLLTLPLFHVHGLGVGVHGTLFNGGSLELRRRFDAGEVLERLGRGGISLFFGVPTMYVRLLEEARRRERRPGGVRLYVSGSAPLSVHTFEEFEAIFGQLILERYGMSETMMNTTNPLDGERRAGTVGAAFPGQQARIVDVRSRQPLPDGETGEIQVRGPHLFRGYWQRPDANAAAFDAQGWFNTGDLGMRSADGYLTINGRAHELIISGGFNVYPREIEEVLTAHPAVAEAAVVGLPDPDLGEQVAAAVVLKSGVQASAEELVSHCRDQLASFKKPRRVFFVEALPRNAMGKLVKNVLREKLLGL